MWLKQTVKRDICCPYRYFTISRKLISGLSKVTARHGARQPDIDPGPLVCCNQVHGKGDPRLRGPTKSYQAWDEHKDTYRPWHRATRLHQSHLCCHSTFLETGAGRGGKGGQGCKGAVEREFSPILSFWSRYLRQEREGG